MLEVGRRQDQALDRLFRHGLLRDDGAEDDAVGAAVRFPAPLEDDPVGAREIRLRDYGKMSQVSAPFHATLPGWRGSSSSPNLGVDRSDGGESKTELPFRIV